MFDPIWARHSTWHVEPCRSGLDLIPQHPDGRRALAEMLRVLKPDGRIVLIDVGYPADGNRLGTSITRLWMLADVIRNMDALFACFDSRVHHGTIGWFGSFHL